MRKFYLWLICLGIAGQMFGQSTANYTFSSATNGSLTDMSSGTTQLVGASSDDGASVLTNIGFDFIFMGVSYNEFSVNANGLLRLGSTVINTAYTNDLSSATNVPQIAPYWDDLATGTNGKVHYKLTGLSSNRILTIEWMVTVPRNTSSAYNATFQCLLYENGGKIEMIYGNGLVSNSGGYSVGFGTSATTYASVASSTSICSYNANEGINKSQNGAITSGVKYTFTPPAAPTAPSSLTFTSITGSGMTLNWTDNATTEIGYAIMRSTDGVNYTTITTTAANVTSYAATGLNFGTTYYWKILAINEGAFSSLTGSQSTNNGSICGNKTVGPTGNYASLTAAFADINTNGLACNVNLILEGTYNSSVETFPIAGPNSAPMGTYTATIYPSVTGLIISSTNTTGTINLNGSRNIVFDGRIGGSGSAKDLVIENTSTTGYVVNFINDATDNTLKYCTVKSVNAVSTSGAIVISTTTGTTGNDNNTIDNCDLRDGATKPQFLVYAAGTSGKENSNISISNCNFFNYYKLSDASAGIYTSFSGNTDWNITNNSFYQTSAYAGTSGTTYGIYIGGGNNYTISGNKIGGQNTNCGGAPWTITGTAAAFKFVGISLSVGTTTTSFVQNNTIQNFDWLTTSNATTGSGAFCGIHIGGGNVNVGTTIGNTIGSSSVDNIKVTSSSSALLVGINSSSLNNVTISNNTIYGLTSISNAAATGSYIIGVNMASGSICAVNSNTIGSNLVANSLRAGTSAVTTGATSAFGINNLSAGNVTINNNILGNIVSFGTSNSSEASGILSNGAASSLSITGNTIRNISGYLAASGTTSLICGINQKNGSAASVNISQNTIFNIENANASATTAYITGILLNGTVSGNICNNNLVYNISFAAATSSNEIRGIYLETSGFTLANNMVRLGYDVSGTVINKDVKFYGIATGGGYANVYHNSIFIGGTGVSSGSNPSAAFRMWSPSGTFNINNNIFYNARINAGGTGKHYAYDLAGTQAAFKVYSDYNVYYAPNSGGVLFNLNLTGSSTADHTTMQAFRYNFNHGTASAPNFQDMHSGIADPKFINPTAATPDIHIQTGVPTPVEASGIAIATITEDFDGDIRSNLTPTDIGADAAIFNSMDDKFTPNITYTALTNGSATCSTTRTLTATITDVGTGVPTSGANVPRIWYKKNSGSWTSTPGSLTSGNGNNGTWDFIMNYSDAAIGGVLNTDKIYYYVAAQDQAPTLNNWYTLFEVAAPIHTSVTTQTTPPANANNYTIVPSYSGTYYIPSGTYKSLTANAADGLFNVLNNGVVTGNITVYIDNNITETGAIALNQWAEDCGSAYSLTILPDATTTRTISATGLAVPMIKINGADRVTIDGTDGRYLTFSNTHPTVSSCKSTILFDNGSTSCTVKNSNIQNNSSSSSEANIGIGSTGSNNNLIFENNNIRDASGTASYNGFYCSSANNKLITIRNNNIFNWTFYGIILNPVGDSCTITGNSFYNNLVTPPSVAQTSIKVSTGQGHTISNNYIGGQSSSCGGSAWINSGSVIFTGINVQVGNSIQTKIENNTIQNISMSSSTSPKFEGVKINTTSPNSNVLVKGNMIGHATTASSILVAGNGTSYIYGIYSTSEEPTCLFESNTIANLTLNSSADGAAISAMKIETGDVKKNKIYKLGRSSGTNYLTIDGLKFEVVNSVVTNEVSNNMISLSTSGLDRISGIQDANGNQPRNYYYNTVYVYGTASATFSSKTYAMNKNNSTDKPHRNNLFINACTGGNGLEAHIAYSALSAAFVSDYNMVVATNNAKGFQYGAGSVYQDLATWKAAGRDNSSWYFNPTIGSSDYANINIANLFVDAANGNLNINTANPEAWFVFGKGIAGASSGNISTDFAGNVRGTTSGYGTCIGAHQFAQPAVAPIVANQTGTLSAGNTTAYTFGNRTICAIDWTAGSAPTAMDVKYYSGCDEPNKEAGNNYHNYYVKCTPTGGSGYTYTMNLRFDQAFTGDLPTITDTRLAKYSSSWYYAADNAPSSVASAEYILTTAGLTSFSSFTGSKKASTLPVELIQFTGIRTEKSALLHWTTATEFNNNYFELLRSVDMQKFDVVATIAGAGNSNNELNYTYSDLIPNDMNGVTIYYKLKQVDFDGKSTISNFVVLQPSVNATNNIIENAWINSSEELIIDYSTSKNASVTLQLIDATGKIVYWSQITVEEGTSQYSLTLHGQMKPGLYLVRVTDGIESTTKKIIIK